jgi:hypothetical protein
MIINTTNLKGSRSAEGILDSEVVEGITLDKTVGGLRLPPTKFLNTSPAKLDFTGDLVMDKSNNVVWKPSIMVGDNYDPLKTSVWDISEMNQQFIYDHIQDDYRYIFWVKKTGELIKDIFIYNTAKVGIATCKAKRFVKLGETLTVADGDHFVCPFDSTQ